MSIHVGANENQVIVLDIPKITTYTIGTDNINVMTSYTAQLSIGYVDEAINYVNSARSKLGAYENRFDHTTKNLEVSSENVTKALSAKIHQYFHRLTKDHQKYYSFFRTNLSG